MTGPAVGENWHAHKQKCITKVNPLTGERAMINQTNTGWWWVTLVVFMSCVFTHMPDELLKVIQVFVVVFMQHLSSAN